MNFADSVWTLRRGPRLVRIILIANFLILLALAGPGRSRELDLALRRAGIEDLIGRSMQVWIVGSTMFSTSLFAWILSKKKKVPPGAPTARIKVEGLLLVLWWLALIGLMAYGFMLGMGG
jgi:hypothetical protein